MDKAAEQGNILAIRHLGDFYYFGYGVDTSKVKGLEYHRKSAVKSSSKNNYKLGMEYYYGKGVEKCYPISFVYFQNAADHGHGESQMYLVDMYMNGLGVDMDTSVASIYLRKMIHQTSSEKQEYPVFLSFSKANIENSSEGYVDYSNESADGAAIEYHKHAAEQQNSFENFMIGTNYHYGANGEQNDSFALIYLTKAKEQGQTGAQKILDSILKNQTNEAG
jgi:TPR repeat protein